MSTSTNFMESEISLNFEDPSIHHDRVLIVGEKKLYVVSGVLSLWSEYFRGLFGGSFNEAEKNEIELNELDADIFEKFLELIYFNNLVNMKVDDIIPLIELSFRFLTPMVLKLCNEYIHNNFDKLDEILLQLLEIACIYGIESLKEILMNRFKDVNVRQSQPLEDFGTNC